jgi:hypothetical protein
MVALSIEVSAGDIGSFCARLRPIELAIHHLSAVSQGRLDLMAVGTLSDRGAAGAQ